MALVREIRRRARLIVGPTLAAILVGYFVLHAFQGDRGILAWAQLRQRVAGAEAELARLEAERARLETRTRALSAGGLDPDFLDERVRRVTGLGRADEYVIYPEPEAPGPGP